MKSKPKAFVVEHGDVLLSVKERPMPSIQKLISNRIISQEEIESRPLVVLVHPYTILGGSQELMRGLAAELSDLGFSCITFDLRGAGSSKGRASISGMPEVNDVVGVCNWAAQHYKKKILLVGSSAGACIAGSAVTKVKEVMAYVGIGYTFGFWASILFSSHFDNILNCEKPKYFVMGTCDGFTSVKTFESKMARSKGPTKWDLVPDVGHFELETPEHEPFLATKILEFVNDLQNSRIL